MDLGIKGKVYIVTGGAKGIGEAIVRSLVAEGGRVMIAGRSKAEGEQLAKALSPSGADCQHLHVELGEASVSQQIVEETVARFGRIDGVVNNAGVNDGASLEKGPEAFRQSFHTNLFHYFDVVHYALPYLKASVGAVVNISSKTALTGQGGTSGYAASKGAQLALTREWAVELAPFGIRINAVVPAEVMTPLYAKWIKTFDHPEEKLAEITRRIPLGQRMTTSEEIASATVFLLSPKSAHTTGQWIIVDGGYVHLDRAIS